jgi:hypothetical protein
MTTYTCKECGKPAKIVNGEAVKECSHKGGLIAHLSAVATGNGGVK